MSYQHCSGHHPLVDIATTAAGFPGGTRVVRWCANCGAVVTDEDVDGRTYPGGVRPMQFPKISQAFASKQLVPPTPDREELLGDAIRALIRQDIRCSDDLPPEQRPVHVSGRRAFGAVYDLLRTRDAQPPAATPELMELVKQAAEFLEGNDDEGTNARWGRQLGSKLSQFVK